MHSWATRGISKGTVLMEEVKQPTIIDSAKKVALGTGGLTSGLPIITTPIPGIGTEERILWISIDEGETWDTNVYIEVDANGKTHMTDYEFMTEPTFQSLHGNNHPLLDKPCLSKSKSRVFISNPPR